MAGIRVARVLRGGREVDEDEMRVIFSDILKARLGSLHKKRKFRKDKPPTIDKFMNLAKSVFNETLRNAKIRVVVGTKRIQE